MAWGMALSGGGVPGVAVHLGFLAGLRDGGVGLPPVMVGTSAGGLVAGALAAGEPLEALCDAWLTLARHAGGLLAGEAWHAAEALRPSATPGLLSLVFAPRGIADVWVADWRPGYGVVASDMKEGRAVVIHRDQPALRRTEEALTATAAFPLLFSGVRGDDGRLYQDGGLYDNLPTMAAQRLGAERVVAVSIDSAPVPVPATLTLDGLFTVVAGRLLRQSPPATVPTMVVDIDVPRGLLSLGSFEGDFTDARARGRVQADALGRFIGDAERG